MALRPKSFAVLEHPFKRPGRPVTKEELLDAAWPETSVTKAVLKVCIRETRDALGDKTDFPRFIQTIHGRGYSFIAELPSNNVPLRLTSFIDREREVNEIKHLLDTTRLLTLTRAGGSGKTRLALRIAGDAEPLPRRRMVDSSGLSRGGQSCRAGRCIEYGHTGGTSPGGN